MRSITSNNFEEIIEFPDPQAKKRYERLIGLDEIKQRLQKEARILLNPELLKKWSDQHHRGPITLIDKFRERSPLFVFTGDVGAGKTELAETFGDQIARYENISVTLYRLSLGSRGTGAVGEMTRLISAAFAEVTELARGFSSKSGRHRSAVILLIDEADAIAQSRELGQMHHEDRAGVNALIRGLSNFATGNIPAIAVMCTNRLTAIDPAVLRRAADLFEFKRPDVNQREVLLESALADAGFTSEQISALAKATGPNGNGNYGYTYSDIAQRLLPQILLDAFPNKPITFERALAIAKQLKPTTPFKDEVHS
ncbi:MAG TPA: AAA family ATPase [Pirellulaceae bacterium]|nr:AAA family ATPase [Pyrinomonadaceae bacterium]HMP65567.1 AAA family ATPase [Pyrinomonadaceae bacterium]HMP70727.1 AAA family ATPase [Pirellulaceae bacterium]